MLVIEFDPHQTIPLVDALVEGPNGRRRVKLVLDTGCAITQIDTGLIETIGYSISNSSNVISIHGPAGDEQEGYLVSAKSFRIFGRSFGNISVGVYDFDNFSKYGIDGLLGWDIIRQFHIEMDGPNGLLKIFQ